MATHVIEATNIDSWPKFHDFFARHFDFPTYYGRNMNAWVDCMSDPIESDVMTLLVENVAHLRTVSPDIYDALVECTAFINWRYTKDGGRPHIALAFHG